jgi:SAM-dependent methyltransferase
MRNSSRTWLFRENKQFATGLPAGSLVLDAGAGDQLYKPLFSHCVYEAADFEKVDKRYAKSTYVCDLGAIPVEDCRFDAVLLNQVMEHLPKPASVLVELRRILKPGGLMMCTAPLFYEEHEKPYDFYRYTQFAWKHLMGEAGFEIIELKWMEGYFGTVAYEMETASKYLPTRPGEITPGTPGIILSPVMVAIRALFRVLAALFYRIDERARYTDRGFPKNYVVIVRKPAASE